MRIFEIIKSNPDRGDCPARKGADFRVAATWQKAAIDWWDTQRDRFESYISDIVIEEAGKGDPQTSAKRLDALSGIPILSMIKAEYSTVPCLETNSGREAVLKFHFSAPQTLEYALISEDTFEPWLLKRIF